MSLTESLTAEVSRRALLRGVGGSAALLAVGAAAATPPWSQLQQRMAGTLYVKGSSGYAAVAHGYNPRFDAVWPSAVARCVSAADVSAAVTFASSNAVPFTVRSGGHALTGWSTGTGLVIDTTLISRVTVDSASATATVGAGARLIDVYQRVSSAGLALPGGTCGSVGISGLAMGGGIGALTRPWGLTCDQLTAATVVFADGSVKQVSASRWPGLFWALRGGGGGSFGVATSFTFRLRPAPTFQVYSMSYPMAAAAAVVAGYQSFIATADARLHCELAFRATPSTGSTTLAVTGTWIGSASALTTQLSALIARIGVQPSSRSVSSQSYFTAMLNEAQCTSYATCHLPPEGSIPRVPSAGASTMVYQPLPSDAIAKLIQQVKAGLSVTNATWTGCTVVGLGGAVRSTTTSDSAYGHRNALMMLHYLARWPSRTPPLDGAPFDAYVRGFRAAMAPWCGTAAYVNYLDSAIADYGNAYWPGTYAQLQTVKRGVDPANLFRFAQSVRG
ncbi:FAD-dependent oxidoreductase [Intrasporangium sp.]|uniref:FAD-binding oxidoreductase n=1 Tax=Intrasporangium sp. TaxID=1925024 RepID=UPI002D76933E|nr:FAD-dependent oxidoreductase [Intrasporangium sp.]